MKRSTLVIGLMLVISMAMPADGQQSLGDVAGSIKLKHPEGESVVIDQDTIGKAPTRRAATTEIDWLRQVVGDCLAATRSFHDIVLETRDGFSFYRDPWRERVEEASLRLEGSIDELGIVTVEGRYADAYSMAIQGADQARDAIAIMRSAIANDRPVFSQSRILSKEAIMHFEDAQKGLGAATREEAAEESAPMINPVEAAQTMNAYCGGRHDPGSSAYDACLANQRAAVDRMLGRSAPGVLLDEVSFNVIRNNCRIEWPEDFVNRDRCEQRRIASKQAQR